MASPDENEAPPSTSDKQSMADDADHKIGSPIAVQQQIPSADSDTSTAIPAETSASTSANGDAGAVVETLEVASAEALEAVDSNNESGAGPSFSPAASTDAGADEAAAEEEQTRLADTSNNLSPVAPHMPAGGSGDDDGNNGGNALEPSSSHTPADNNSYGDGAADGEGAADLQAEQATGSSTSVLDVSHPAPTDSNNNSMGAVDEASVPAGQTTAAAAAGGGGGGGDASGAADWGDFGSFSQTEALDVAAGDNNGDDGFGDFSAPAGPPLAADNNDGNAEGGDDFGDFSEPTAAAPTPAADADADDGFGDFSEPTAPPASSEGGANDGGNDDDDDGFGDFSASAAPPPPSPPAAVAVNVGSGGVGDNDDDDDFGDFSDAPLAPQPAQTARSLPTGPQPAPAMPPASAPSPTILQLAGEDFLAAVTEEWGGIIPNIAPPSNPNPAATAAELALLQQLRSRHRTSDGGSNGQGGGQGADLTANNGLPLDAAGATTLSFSAAPRSFSSAAMPQWAASRQLKWKGTVSEVRLLESLGMPEAAAAAAASLEAAAGGLGSRGRGTEGGVSPRGGTLHSRTPSIPGTPNDSPTRAHSESLPRSALDLEFNDGTSSAAATPPATSPRNGPTPPNGSPQGRLGSSWAVPAPLNAQQH